MEPTCDLKKKSYLCKDNKNAEFLKMGMSASSAVSQVQNQMIMNTSQSCTMSPKTSDILNCPTVSITNCNNFHNICEIKGTVSVGCTGNQTSDAAVKALTDATAKAKAALGVSFSSSESLTSTSMENSLTNNCTQSPTTDLVVNSAPIYCVNSNDASQQTILDCDQFTRCQLGQATSAVQTAAATALSDAQGWDPISDLLGPISQVMKDAIVAIIIIAIIVVFAIIGLVAMKLLVGRKKAAAAPAAPVAQVSQAPTVTQPPPPYYGGGYGY